MPIRVGRPTKRRGPLPRRSRAGRVALLVTLAIAALLTGCTELDTTAVAPMIHADTPTAFPPSGTAEPQASPRGAGSASVRTTLPAARRVYFTRGSDLYQLPVDNLPAPVITGRNILAFAPSPDGERVLVAVQDDEGAAEFAIVNANSTVAAQIPDPRGGDGSVAVRALAWSPDGGSIAVAWQDGTIAIVGADGTIRALLPAEPGSAPGDLAWSPDGTRLAYLDPDLPGEATSLYVLPADGGQLRALATAERAEDAVVAAAWLPGRRALAFIRSSPSTIVDGGDVFAVDADGGPATLLISTGRFAPVSGAIDLAASPDGRYLALTVFIPGERQATYHSLWLMDLESGTLSEASTARGEEVTDLWWAGGDLIYRAIDASRAVLPGVYTGVEPFALYQCDPETDKSTERYRS